MSTVDMGHLHYIAGVAADDVAHLREKERTYGGSWKKRGGVGAFMMLARKWDRVENILGRSDTQYDIFAAIEKDPSGGDGTVLAEIRDLRRYLLLVEAEMVARGVVGEPPTDIGITHSTNTEYNTEPAAAEIRRVPGVGVGAARVPVHAVGDPRPVPVEDSNRHADRARRDGLNIYEYSCLPEDEQALYYMDVARGEYRLKRGGV